MTLNQKPIEKNIRMNWQIVNDESGEVIALTVLLSDADALCDRANRCHRNAVYAVYEYNRKRQVLGAGTSPRLQDRSRAGIKEKTMIRKGQIVHIKAEWQDAGDDKFTWTAIEDERSASPSYNNARIKLRATGESFASVMELDVDMLCES